MEWLKVLVSPAILSALLLIVNHNLGKRIDDLRSEMKSGLNVVSSDVANLRNQTQREHDALAKKVDDLKLDVRDLTATVTKHISNLDIHSKG